MSRSLAPRPSLENLEEEGSAQPNPKNRKISTACNACKVRKTRCTGTAPCEACATRNSNCVYDQTSDQRRKIANQRNLQELVEAQTNLERLKQLLGGILATLRAGHASAGEDLIATIRSGVDLSQLAAHVRNACRSERAIQEALSAMDFEIDGPEELPSPTQLLTRMQDYSTSSHSFDSDNIDTDPNPLQGFLGLNPSVYPPNP